MKKVISVLLALAMTFALCSCSARGTAYTPEYGQELVINENLEYKDEYKDAISPETRQSITDFLLQMTDFYNSVDPTQQQSVYFTYVPYYYSNNFLSSIESLTISLTDKEARGTRLTDKEQLFLDAADLVCAIPIKLSEIDSAAYSEALERLESAEDTADRDETGRAEADSEANSEAGSSRSSRENSGDDTRAEGEDAATVEYIKLNEESWQELFDLYVKAYETLYTNPFVK